jgi:hypothetical protein
MRYYWGMRRTSTVRWAEVKHDSSDTNDNFTLLTSLDWQVHVYGEATAELHRVCDSHKLPLHILSWCPEIRTTGLQRNALYLVRPDGYVGLADAKGSATALTSYLDTRKLTLSR